MTELLGTLLGTRCWAWLGVLGENALPCIPLSICRVGSVRDPELPVTYCAWSSSCDRLSAHHTYLADRLISASSSPRFLLRDKGICITTSPRRWHSPP